MPVRMPPRALLVGSWELHALKRTGPYICKTSKQNALQKVSPRILNTASHGRQIYLYHVTCWDLGKLQGKCSLLVTSQEENQCVSWQRRAMWVAGGRDGSCISGKGSQTLVTSHGRNFMRNWTHIKLDLSMFYGCEETS